MNKKSPMRKLHDSRIFWLVVSLLASFATWIYVTSGESTETRQVFRNVPVEITGEDALLRARDMVITDVSASTVNVEVLGPRRIVGVLKSSDLVARVDVSKLTVAGETAVRYEVVYPAGTDTRDITEVSMSPETVSFMVSKMATNTVPVRGGFEGTLEQGYIAETPVFEPSTITLSGPEVYIKDVAYAWVTFGNDITISSSYSVETSYTLMDQSGNPCPTENLSFAPETVIASLPILESKEISLGVDLIEGSGATSANTKVTVEPATITLAGDSGILDGINRIILGTVDLTDFSVSTSEVYTIPINNALTNLTGVKEATVTVEVKGLETRTFEVKNISYINAAEGAEVEVLSNSIDVLLRGTPEQMAQLKSENIRAVADLTDFKDSTGAYMPAVRIYVDGFTDVGPIGSYTISLEIKKT